MSKLVLYLAMSLDGKISGPDHDVQWLEEVPNPNKSDFGYYAFAAGISTTIMGRTTYQWVKDQGVPWPYTSTDNYVLTSDRKLEDNDEVCFISENHFDYIRDLKERADKDIWLIGGAKVNQSCLNAGLVDEVRVHVMPILLGEGTTLFTGAIDRKWLEHIETISHDPGVTELRYAVKN